MKNPDSTEAPILGPLMWLPTRPVCRWVTFTGVPSTLTNFPVLVKATNFGKIKTGYDVHFQDAGGTELAFELDWYDDSTKSGAWWVQIPTLTSGTSIKMLYGDSGRTTDQSSPETVWADYDYVYHFTDPDNMKSSVGTYVAEAYNNGVDFSSITQVSNSLTGRGIEFQINSGYGNRYAGIRFANKVSGVPVVWSTYMSSIYVPDGHNVSGNTGWTLFGFNYYYAYHNTYAGGQTNRVSVGASSMALGLSTSSSEVSWVQDCSVLDSSACTANSFRWDDPTFTANGAKSVPNVFVLEELRIGSVFKDTDWLLYEQRNLSQHGNYTTYSDETAA